jgi:hypothetical protein
MKISTFFTRLISYKKFTTSLLVTLLTLGIPNLLYSQLNLAYSMGGVGNLINNGISTSTLSNPVILTGTKCYIVSNGLSKFMPISNGQFFTSCEVNLDYIKLSIKIFPNPASSYTTVKFLSQLQTDEKFRLEIFTSTGYIVEGLDITQKQFLSGYHLNLNNLSPGVYYIQISSNTVLQSYKILKQ